LRRIREEIGMQQKDLATLSEVSPSMLWRVETGKELPTPELAKTLLDKLGVDTQIRKEMLRLLEKERDGRGRQRKKRGGKQATADAMLAFGKELQEVLKRLQISAAEFGRTMNRPASSVQAWVSGILSPSDETIVQDIIPVLEEAGASGEELRGLKAAHLKDSLTKALNLSYLSEDEQQELISILEKHYGKNKEAKTRTK
jgi:DNA-binding transcriptional regulator YiaG